MEVVIRYVIIHHKVHIALVKVGISWSIKRIVKVFKLL